jgi:hypothetical protein
LDGGTIEHTIDVKSVSLWFRIWSSTLLDGAYLLDGGTVDHTIDVKSVSLWFGNGNCALGTEFGTFWEFRLALLTYRCDHWLRNRSRTLGAEPGTFIEWHLALLANHGFPFGK